VFLLGLCCAQCKALRGGAKDVGVDDRVAVSYQMMSMSVAATLRFLYPTMYALHELGEDVGTPGPDGRPVMPPPVALASEVLDTRGVYLLDDGMLLICWVRVFPFASSQPVLCLSRAGLNPGSKGQGRVTHGRGAVKRCRYVQQKAEDRPSV